MGKKNILLIDDDKLVLKSIQSLLVKSGYEVFCAADGREAEVHAAAHPINLVISDVRMPGDGGISVMTRLKSSFEKAGKEVPFIFVTGYASDEAPIDAIKLGAKDYILKPFDLFELLKSVQKNIL